MKQTTKPATPHLVVACYLCGRERPWGEPCPTCTQPLPASALPGIALAVLIGLSVVGVGVGLAWLLFGMGR